MINIESMVAIRQRIGELNTRFGIASPKMPAVNKSETFAKELAGAIQRTDKTPTTALGTDTRSMLTRAAQKYKLDPRLVEAVAQVESGGKQEAVSSAGAIGVMQLMPDTASSLGVNPYDKGQNIEGGVRYLKNMLDTFNGNIPKALAAYNAGPGAVREYNGIPPYKETEEYVNKVLDIFR